MTSSWKGAEEVDASGLAVLITATGTAIVGILGAFAAFLKRRPEDIEALHTTITRLRDQLDETDTRYTDTRAALYQLRDRYDVLWTYAMNLRELLDEPPAIPEEARHDH